VRHEIARNDLRRFILNDTALRLPVSSTTLRVKDQEPRKAATSLRVKEIVK